MGRFPASFRHNLARCVALIAAVGVIGLAAGCSDDDEDTPPATTSTQFSGTLSGNNEAGALNFGVSSASLARGLMSRSVAAAVVTASGTINFAGPGGVINVSGTYDTVNDSLYLTGGGYVLIGHRASTVAGEGIQGTYSGPNGDGAFSVLVTTSASPAKVYCGTYHSNTDADSGYFNVAVRGTNLHGFAISEDGGDAFTELEGTVTGTGSTRLVTVTNPDDPNDSATGTLTVATDSLSGTYSFGVDTGTWIGGLCQ